MSFLKEGEHYRVEREKESGFGECFTVIAYEFQQQVMLSIEALYRVPDKEILRKQAIAQLVRELEEYHNKVLFKAMIENLPITARTNVKYPDTYFQPASYFRDTRIGMSYHVPERTSLLIVHPKDYIEIEEALRK